MNTINPLNPKFDAQAKIEHFDDAGLEKRRRMALLGAISTLGAIVILAGLQVNDLAKLLIFIPAFIACLGLYQTITKFCIPLNFEHILKTDEIKRAWNVIAWSLVIAIVVTALSMLLS